MQTVRSNITRLKHQIESAFQEEGDLFEFPGVTRPGLVSLMDSAHAESYELLDSEEDFEVVLLKRKIAEPLERCRNYLSDYKGGKKDGKYFHEFVRSLTEVRDQVRLTYLICKKSGLRTENEIQLAKESLRSLLDTKSELETKLTLLLKTHDELESKLKSVSESDSEAQEHLSNTKNASSEVQSLQAKSSAAFEVVSKYEAQITEARESAIENSAEVSALVSQGEKATEDLKQVKLDLNEISGKTKEHQERCKKLSDEISTTLAAANRVGMAGSFDSRKRELRTSLIMWGICFVLSIGSILGIGLWLILPHINDSAHDLLLQDAGLKLLVVTHLIWLAWMSARQYGYIARIREDYSFKYATAMAFEGYKKQAQEIDEELLRKLMLQAIDAVGQNPIRLYSVKDNHASPVHEVVENTLDRAKTRVARKAVDKSP